MQQQLSRATAASCGQLSHAHALSRRPGTLCLQHHGLGAASRGRGLSRQQQQQARPVVAAAALSAPHRLLTTSRSTAAANVACRASGGKSNNSSSADPAQEPSLLYSAVPLALWAGLMGYVFFLAPNQTPTIDSFVVQKLVGLQQEDPFAVNEVFTAVWNCMGLYPLIYAAILIPAARNDGKLPAWPFVTASVFLGAYALIPYMCLWTPQRSAPQLPLPASELEGWNKFYMRAAETPWLPAGLLAGAAYWVWHAASAGGLQWLQFLQLFDESRLTHATSLDFMLCSLLMPFWMGNDAERRDWGPRSALVPLLSLLPLVGPSLYLLLRPKTFGGGAGDAAE